MKWPQNYLDVAEAVLRDARRPMTAGAILKAAFEAGIVPPHLFGKTQHKTLHARLSEDILNHKLESRFFRTDPGKFFLSDFRSDPAIPNEFKDPFHARRRARDLQKPAALAIEKGFLERESRRGLNWLELFSAADKAGAVRHVNPRRVADGLLLVWAFSVVRRNHQILSYRVGRYRDNRDAFANRKSIGFAEMVGWDDQTLFSADMGVTECGLNAVLTDLDLSKSVFQNRIFKPSVSFLAIAMRSAIEPVALFVMEWQCPEWFEPMARRLSLNEVRWIDGTHQPNDIDEFEPWSAIAIEGLVRQASQKKPGNEENIAPASGFLSL